MDPAVGGRGCVGVCRIISALTSEAFPSADLPRNFGFSEFVTPAQVNFIGLCPSFNALKS